MEIKVLQFNEGRIIDASFVIAPRKRKTRDENEQIKQGAGDKLWNYNPHKKCHKDVDARWTKKRDETFYGYKQHTKVEKRNKIILSRSEERRVGKSVDLGGRSIIQIKRKRLQVRTV